MLLEWNLNFLKMNIKSFLLAAAICLVVIGLIYGAFLHGLGRESGLTNLGPRTERFFDHVDEVKRRLPQTDQSSKAIDTGR